MSPESSCHRALRAEVEPPRQQSILPFVHHTFVVTFVAITLFVHTWIRPGHKAHDAAAGA